MAESVLAEEYKKRTKAFAIKLIRFIRPFPRTDEAAIIGKQLLRSGTSIAANYRAVCTARSKAEFISKIGVVVEEADETVFWLELVLELQLADQNETKQLLKEANELLAIFGASQRTAKSNPSRGQSGDRHGFSQCFDESIVR